MSPPTPPPEHTIDLDETGLYSCTGCAFSSRIEADVDEHLRETRWLEDEEDPLDSMTGGLPPPPPARPKRPVPVQQPRVRALQWSSRYILGDSDSAFYIWDRLSPRVPIRAYERTDEGWRRAVAEYQRLVQAGTTPHVAPRSPSPSKSSPVGSIVGLALLVGWLILWGYTCLISVCDVSGSCESPVPWLYRFLDSLSMC